MRAHKILEVAKDNNGPLQVRAGQHGQHEQAIPQLRSLRNAVLALREIDALKKYAEITLTHLPVVDTDETIRMPNHVAEALMQAVQQLRLRNGVLIDVLQSILEPEKPGNVYFKVPHTSDLAKIGELIADLDRNFQLIFLNNPENNFTVKFDGFEKGTDWIQLYIESASCVGIFLFVVRAVMATAKLSIELERKSLEHDEYEADKNLRDQYRAMHQKILDGNIKKQVNQICQKLEIDVNDPKNVERMNTINAAIRDLKTTFISGVEVEVPKLTAAVNDQTREESSRVENECKDLVAAAKQLQIPGKID